MKLRDIQKALKKAEIAFWADGESLLAPWAIEGTVMYVLVRENVLGAVYPIQVPHDPQFSLLASLMLAKDGLFLSDAQTVGYPGGNFLTVGCELKEGIDIAAKLATSVLLAAAAGKALIVGKETEERLKIFMEETLRLFAKFLKKGGEEN